MYIQRSFNGNSVFEKTRAPYFQCSSGKYSFLFHQSFNFVFPQFQLMFVSNILPDTALWFLHCSFVSTLSAVEIIVQELGHDDKPACFEPFVNT